ncbi:outer membrane beta-barrel family protein [Hydrobacter penzbergensis]|nr:outer membrane beta-barrel family protein [Hydrobacter penzbergensis]
MKLLFVLFVCTLQQSFAQVKGRLMNTDRIPVAFASVMLLRSGDSSMVVFGMSDNDGNYSLNNIVPGKYWLRFSATGYNETQSPVFELTEQQKDFGTQVMSKDVKELQEVTVRSERALYQQKTEGLTVNVGSSIFTKGSSALDVLGRSPGVLVNRRNNTIELNGKPGVKIMLNGKLMYLSEEQLFNLLSGMSADNIATIELLTSPTAKYDAEGSAGLINIVLKKNKNIGTNGSESLTAGYGYREKIATSFNLSHNTKHMNLYGDYTYSRNHTYSSMDVDSWQDMPFMGGKVHTQGLDTTDALFSNHNVTVGMDARLNERTSIGGSVIYTNNRSSGSTFGHFQYNVLPDSLLKYDGVNSGANQWNNIVSSAYLEKRFHQGESMNINVDYLFFENNDHYMVQSSFVNKYNMQAGNHEALSAPAQKGAAHTNINVIVGKTDYMKQWGSKTKLEAGIKIAHTTNTSSSGFKSWIDTAWTSNRQTTSSIIMRETIGAAYASMTIDINTSTHLTTGIRYEYVTTQLNNADTGASVEQRNMGALFPNVLLTKKINAQNELQLSYTKRISRPSYNDMASYVGYSDPTTVYTGNPFLQPTITHNVRLGYYYKRYALSILFSRDINTIVRYQLTESPEHNMLYISPQNMSWQNNITFQATLPVSINNWWTMNWNFIGGSRKYAITYAKQPVEYGYFAYSVNYTHTFKLPRLFSVELSGNYNNQSYNGTQRVEGFHILNIGLKKELKDNKGSFQFSVNDIFRRERYEVHYGTITREPFDIMNRVVVYTEPSQFTIFKIGYSRSFGNGKKAEKRSAVSSDEQERIRKE